jgi:hypothetical protein
MNIKILLAIIFLAASDCPKGASRKPSLKAWKRSALVQST